MIVWALMWPTLLVKRIGQEICRLIPHVSSGIDRGSDFFLELRTVVTHLTDLLVTSTFSGLE